ncbi:MAG TPA: phosphate ABC transporter substrate-binding protein PstS [Candidatus Eremiobacteraceae bacterium]|nr:phosphate ABC transporter substrate-binding protein PstS [Candidatus Eremiobacteraceae bacterium]
MGAEIRRMVHALVALSLSFAIVAVGNSFGQQTVTLVATGSSLPEPLYLTWGEEFHKTQPAVQLRYLAEGTSTSAERILAGTGDFGGGDAPIPEKELSAGKQKVVELPTVLIGIAVVYNLPGVHGLRLTGSTIAKIFLGKITTWHDPEIARLNPDAKLPDLAIKVLHRTEGKGSSYIFSDYLSKVSPEFQAKVGKSASPKWPVGASVARTQDMLDQLKITVGAIAYTEANWVEKTSSSAAEIKNADGEFVRPNAKSIAAAAAAEDAKYSQSFRVSLTNAPGKESYPIASFTWLYVPERASDSARGKAINEFLRWIYSRGQEIARERGYAPLPASVLGKAREKAAAIR